MGRDHFHAACGHGLVELVAIVGLVADEILREVDADHEVKDRFDQAALVRAGTAGAHGNGKSLGIHHQHDLDALASLGCADAIATALGLGEGSKPGGLGVRMAEKLNSVLNLLPE